MLMAVTISIEMGYGAYYGASILNHLQPWTTYRPHGAA